MSWIEKLYRTYDNNAGHIGDPNDKVFLLPVGHTDKKTADVEITLDACGNFLRGSPVPESDARTIVAATEESAGRTSGGAPHALCDELQYVAADYQAHGGTKQPYFDLYQKQLTSWCASRFNHTKIQAVLVYVTRGRVMADLTSAQVLKNGQTDAFVRWCVDVPGDPQRKLWTDSSIWKSWADYYASTRATCGLCYVTGNNALLADQHPRKIRDDGDGAKLVSSNDESGFTFLGRFSTADQAAGVGFEVTQKAHNALRWLIARQGFVEYVGKGLNRKPSLAIVAWAVSGAEIPDPLSDTQTLLSGKASGPVTTLPGYTAQETGIQLSKLIAGYSVRLGPTDDVVVIVLDSATPGRMAMRFYRELTGSEFLERVKAWHDVDDGCTWQQRLDKDRVFFGAPAPRDIAETAYGRRVDDNLRKATVERLLPSIVDGAQLPRDLVDSCVRRACNKFGIEHWEWERALGIACALYRYHNKERRYKMTLEIDRKTRDYLYGRLLALADHLEVRALYLAKEERETNAGRLMQRFADRPNSTWRSIELSLGPYKSRLRAKRPGLLLRLETEMDEVFQSFAPGDFNLEKPLSGEFLLGFHCQRSSCWANLSNQGEDSEGAQETTKEA
ncbi:MAG: type I-C CRISPR-associated protein Cas8c/Csd1 [Chloroflexi bacterium]|nr:type I-C CRISPR-associated protein Cas8c/Csd1 [Chloroflexota bacterium]